MIIYVAVSTFLFYDFWNQARPTTPRCWSMR